MDQKEKSVRWGIFWVSLASVLIFALIIGMNAYGSYLQRLDEAQRYAIAKERGGHPVCVAPDGIYIKYPNLDTAPSGAEG